MAKPVPRPLFLTLCVLALTCVASVDAETAKPAKAAKAPAKTSVSQTPVVAPSATPAISPQMQLARKYSPIQYCHGASYPAVSWMQVRDFQDQHSPSAPAPPTGSSTKPVATDPKLATIPKLEYPESMRASAMDGAVSVMVAVTREGTASDALVICSNHSEFSAAALLAVKAATFSPATRDGKPVESVATLPIDFHP
jgi:TonB family protein